MNLTGNTVGGTNSSAGTCGGNNALEVAYTFTQVARGPFLVTVSPALDAGTLRPTLYLRGPGCDAGTEVACTPGGGPFTPRSINELSLDAGVYTLFVDTSATGAPGPYVLSAYQGSLAGDTCTTNPRAINLSTATSVTVTGDTTIMGQHYAASCNDGSSGRGTDLVYQVSIPRSGTLNAYTRGTFDIVLAAKRGASCSTSPEVACSDADYDGVASHEEVNIPVNVGETVWLWLTGFGTGDEGQFHLIVSLP